MEVRAEGDGEGASKPQASLITPHSEAKSMAGGEKTASRASNMIQVRIHAHDIFVFVRTTRTLSVPTTPYV